MPMLSDGNFTYIPCVGVYGPLVPEIPRRLHDNVHLSEARGPAGPRGQP